MAIEILIPKIYVTAQHCQHLFELWEKIAQLPDSHLDIVLSFSECDFLSHNGVAFLGGLAHWVHQRGGQLTFDWDSLDQRIMNNLAQNGFLYHFGHEQNPWDGNSIPYRLDTQRNQAEMMDYLLNKWLGRGWVNISPALQFAIAGRVWEIYDNAFSHSQSAIGIFSCGQHYPNQKELHLTIIDFGVGIPTQVRSLPENAQLSTPEALEWAFFPGNSTAPSALNHAISRGMGLHLLQEFLLTNQGSLKIFSNDGYVKIKNRKIEYYPQRFNFSGTFVNIAFQCDESFYYLASELSSASGPLF
jgi:hypothetical protein